MKNRRPLLFYAIIISLIFSVFLISCESGGYSESPYAADYGSPDFYASGIVGESASDKGLPSEHNTEEYNRITENPFISAKYAPLSTFAADVDTASYANLRRMINSEMTDIPAGSVRIEEMINYFSYDYPEPDRDAPFSVTTSIAPCPWNDETSLLLIGLQTKKTAAEDMPASNLVFLIDVSGSMSSYDKLPLVKRAFLMLTENLTQNDTVSIVTYASSDSVILNGVNGSEKATIMNAIENLESGGSTAGSKGIQTAYEIAASHFIKGGNNRVILATDGDLNVGITSESALEKLITEKKNSGVFLSVMGFGTGNIKDNKMETLADKGNGNYSYIDTIDEARKVLIEERGGTLLTVAKDVKLQVEFNPAQIKGYRLIGYENRLLDAQDFIDDTKDGGEIGAGHRVTALYEIAFPDSAQIITEPELKYQGNNSDTTILSDEYLTVNIRYKEPDKDVSIPLSFPVTSANVVESLSPDMRFAACVAQFGMLLSDSQYKGASTYGSLISSLDSLGSYIENDTLKKEFRALVEKAMNISGLHTIA